ncbi:hypothetical protein NUW58_g10560 [Xylaria curta]|uniref:Uncharacterized protein n=1 Tax=Xylaria curta TaxID=42375 RepID=A0ACC1MKS9_9PEZI|nr:hypothetical protein NUW58_g10560 [Xylaria curta]
MPWLWYPTLVLNLDVKKALPPEGAEWLHVRVHSKHIENGRFDYEAVVSDQAGNIVALSHHVAMVVDGSRNVAARGAGESPRPQLPKQNPVPGSPKARRVGNATAAASQLPGPAQRRLGHGYICADVCLASAAPLFYSGASASVPDPDHVLTLGKGVSLALGTDTLVIKDKDLARRHRNRRCGIPIGLPPTEITLPYHNIIWAFVGEKLVIEYAAEDSLECETLQYALAETPEATARAWIEILLQNAYGRAQRQRRAKVLINPHAGPGGANDPGRGGDKAWGARNRNLRGS